MPRPDDLTDEFLAECEREFDASDDVPSYMKSVPAIRKTVLEVWISGVWLNHRLEEDGCPGDLARKIGFSHGQMCLGRDPWMCARACLDQYREGFYAEPGLQLAGELLSGDAVTIRPLPEEA